MMVESAIQFAGHSYRCWLVALSQQQRWQDAAVLLQRGILALCKPLSAAGGNPASEASGRLPAAQAAAALDLGLHLLHLLCCVGDADSRAALLAWAAGDAGSSSKTLPQRSRAALQQALQQHPHLLCTLAISCAYAALHNSLPTAMVHSLGCQLPPLSAQLQGWQPAPAAVDLSASSACRAALSLCSAALGLPQARESPAQQQQQPAPQLLAARCTVLTAALRLGGSPLVGELIHMPHCTDALTVVQQCWHTCSGQPPAELLILLQEAVVSAAAAAATSRLPGSSSGSCGNPLVVAALQGKLHPAAVVALAAAVAGSGHAQAADAVLRLLGSWAIAYEAWVSYQHTRIQPRVGPGDFWHLNVGASTSLLVEVVLIAHT